MKFVIDVPDDKVVDYIRSYDKADEYALFVPVDIGGSKFSMKLLDFKCKPYTQDSAIEEAYKKGVSDTVAKIEAYLLKLARENHS